MNARTKQTTHSAPMRNEPRGGNLGALQAVVGHDPHGRRHTVRLSVVTREKEREREQREREQRESRERRRTGF